MALCPVSKVARERYSRHPRTLKRWSEDPALKFPKFKTINGRNYLDDAELDVFDRDCVQHVTSKSPTAEDISKQETPA
jgi:hypothetical protein